MGKLLTVNDERFISDREEEGEKERDVDVDHKDDRV